MAIYITINDEQARRVLAWAGKLTEANVEDGCEPTGYELVISVSPYGVDAEARGSGRTLSLGECEFRIG